MKQDPSRCKNKAEEEDVHPLWASQFSSAQVPVWLTNFKYVSVSVEWHGQWKETVLLSKLSNKKPILERSSSTNIQWQENKERHTRG